MLILTSNIWEKRNIISNFAPCIMKTMKRLIFFLLGIYALTSCLKGNEDNVTYYDDSAITAFSLGTLKRTVHTKSSTGADSTYVTTYDASAVKFTIDQGKRLIYNTDSLVNGIDSLHMICNVTAINSGIILLKSMVSDTLFYYKSTDSISFKRNPRTFIIMSNNGLSRNDYQVKVNFKHEDELSGTKWDAPYEVGIFKDASGIQLQPWKEYMLAKVVKDGVTNLYTLPQSDGKTWTQLTTNITLDNATNIAIVNDMLYASDSNGQICSSADGQTWTAAGTMKASQVYGYSTGWLYALCDGKLTAYDILTGTSNEESFYEQEAERLPLFSTPPSLIEMTTLTSSSIKSTVIVGTDKNGTTRVMYKGENKYEPQKWMELTNEEKGKILTSEKNVRVTKYKDKQLVSASDSRLAISDDYGRSWLSPWNKKLPTFKTANEKAREIVADKYNRLWLITNEGNVYRGRY